METISHPVELAAWDDAWKNNLIKRVLRMGGIKPSAEDLPEDFPWWLKRRKGTAVDGLATEMGFEDSRTFIAAIQKELRMYYRNQNGKVKAPQFVQPDEGQETDGQARTSSDSPAPILIDIVAQNFYSPHLVEGTIGVCSICRLTGPGKECRCGFPYTLTVRIQAGKVVGIYANFY